MWDLRRQGRIGAEDDCQALDGTIEKQSPTLGREAVYSSTQRLSRLPTYLTVHMVRFAWKRDINKKAKIMVCVILLSRSSNVPTQMQCMNRGE